MNNYLKKNIDIIKKIHDEIKTNEDIIKELEGSDNIQEVNLYNGYMLKSNIDNNKAISVWCEQFKELTHNTIVTVFGTGSLDYYQQLIRLYPDFFVIFYEPVEENFYRCLCLDDYSELLKKDKCLFCVGEDNFNNFMSYVYSVFGFETINKPYIATIPNCHKIFEKEYAEYEETLINVYKSNVLSRNTLIHYEEDMLNNYIDNLTKFEDATSVLEVKEEFGKYNIEDYPAIVLSAGPSLDKNIEEIIDLKGRAFILCVDAALNTATKYNIRPDVVLSVDAEMYEDSLRDELGREVPLLTHMHGALTIRDASRGRKIYVSDKDRYLEDLLAPFDKMMLRLATGGSVANTAFSFAKELGFKNIILMGQDLGFPGNKHHAEDAFEDEEDANENDKDYFYVESIDGGEVLTRTDMDAYRLWFEETIQLSPEINVIDATEGGALIKGTEIITIREAIDKYCPKGTLDFEGMIVKSNDILDDEEKEIVKKDIKASFDNIDYNIDYLKKAKRDYYKLRDINEKKKYNTKEFIRAIEKVGVYNKYFDENKDFELYKRCCTKKYFEVIDELKIIHDDDYENIKKLVDLSLIMLDEYIKAARVLKEKWGKIGEW